MAGATTLLRTDDIKAVDAAVAAAPSADGGDKVSADSYVTKLNKYIPTEIVTLFIFIEGILKTVETNAVVEWGLFFLLLILTPVYMWRATVMKSEPPACDQIIVSFFSFGLWVYVIGGPFSALSWYVPQYGYILVAVFTVFVPLLKK
jgi:hypothetical protein